MKKNKLSIWMAATTLILAMNNVFGAPVYQPKDSPDVTFDKVQEIFGSNTDPENESLKLLLLAIGLDHTSANSPNIQHQIGIPYIVEKGPIYWKNRYKQGGNEIDVLVNNALLLLLSKERDDRSMRAGEHLMEAAANEGYWPAIFYTADKTLKDELTDKNRTTILDDPYLARSAKALNATKVMNDLNTCAEIGFAPCQFRIGFWLSSSDKTMNDAVIVLQKAVETTFNDNRYSNLLDNAVHTALEIIVYKGRSAGIDESTIKHYSKLLASFKKIDPEESIN